ncbi:glycosyltransferase [uncultured Sunxiuqinia sp.]|uniref:glycosyltransferase n=1 Tax=uncultured Sunxiuqinia sp. TaxID=1573825 RepID=UPI00260BC0E7|nr:glycosyltransferase [uncultured Sunxiuqinia sp.]
MKILHTISTLDLSAGGPPKSVCDLAVKQAEQGHDVTVLAKATDHPYLKHSPHPNLQLQFVNKQSFKQALHEVLIKDSIELFHSHSLWSIPLHQMAQSARKNNLPYIISPRGTLHPWALNVKKWKKRLAMVLYQQKDLQAADCIQATSKIEAAYFRNLKLKNPIAIIPNGVDLQEFPVSTFKRTSDKRTVLFLSRVHSQKGLSFLVKAWQMLEPSYRSQWQLEIAGNGDEAYVASLQKQIEESGLSKQIHITGPQYGAAKLAAYHRADLFVLPTYSENFGVVVAEALACGVPVITTKGTPWEELNTGQAGWWIDIGAEPLTKTLTEAMLLGDKERQRMGLNGSRLIEKNYSIQAVSAKMIDLYAWVLKEKEKPEFVEIL